MREKNKGKRNHYKEKIEIIYIIYTHTRDKTCKTTFTTFTTFATFSAQALCFHEMLKTNTIIGKVARLGQKKSP